MATSLLLLLIPAGYLLLMLLLRRREKTGPKGKRYARLGQFPRLMFWMRQALQINASLPGAAMLQRERQALLLSILRFQRDMKQPPLLPCAEEGGVRIMALAREAWQQDALTPETLQSALTSSKIDTTLDERLALPLCLRALLLEELTELLRQLMDDARQLRLGRHLAYRLRHQKQPEAWLSRCQPSLPCLSAMLTELRQMERPALSARVDEWLEERRGCTAADIAHQHSHHQTKLAEAISRISAALHQLDAMDWPMLTEDTDPLHRLLSRDPAQVYTAMTPESRLMYRQRAARLARLFHMEEAALLRACLALCAEADPDALERHVGWYLTEAEGINALRQSLETRKGFLICQALLHQLACRRTLAMLLGLAGGYLFLRLGYSLWLLPIFWLLWASLCRRVLPERSPTLPQLAVDRITESMRTLVVMPTVLQDHHAAIHAVSQLLRIRRTLPEGSIDCLLLGDWTASLTLRSAEDGDVLTAAQAAIQAVNDASDDGTQYFYLQRARVWQHAQHMYLPLGDRMGAVETVCRLVSQGLCHDALDAASLDPSLLHRRYTWVMIVDPQAQGEPLLLPTLAGVLAHPLNMRMQTSQGYRGYSMVAACTTSMPQQHPTLLQHMASMLRRKPDRSDLPAACLIAPDALLESIDGLFSSSHPGTGTLYARLSGAAKIHAMIHVPPAATVEDKLAAQHRRTQELWRCLAWTMTHVQTASGFQRNPLSLAHRADLRRKLLTTLTAPAQAALLAIAAFHSDPVLTALALTLPALHMPLTGTGLLANLCRLALLPTEAIFRLDAIWHGLLALIHPGQQSRLMKGDVHTAVGLWSQALYAALLAAMSTVGGRWFFPGLLLAGLMALAPLLRARLAKPVMDDPVLSDAQEQLLHDMADASWRWFEHNVTEATRYLPLEWVQHQPASMTAETTTPRAVGLYFLSCLSARELGLIDTTSLFGRVGSAMDTMEALPRWRGLPFARYRLDSLAPDSAMRISARDCGLLGAALLTVAQGLRKHLAEAEVAHQTLPARLDAFVHTMQLDALYDASAGLFHAFVDAQKLVQDAPHIELFADEGLLLSFVAVMLRKVPVRHLRRLQRTLVQCGHLRPMLTLHGCAEDTLLPALMLPMPLDTLPGQSLRAAVRLQFAAAHEGLFGLGESAYHAFDPQLHYAVRRFGMPEHALEEYDKRRVYAPHACALSLPFLPIKAVHGLLAMRSLGMLSRTGFLDAVDFSGNAADTDLTYTLVHLQRADHLGMTLCAICNALTEDTLTQLLTDMPVASACLLPLHTAAQPLVLPARQGRLHAVQRQEQSFQHQALHCSSPMDAHVLGDAHASILIATNGCNAIRLDGRTVTRFTADASQIEGLQLYLHEGSSLWRLTDPLLPGETVFSEGLAVWKRQAGHVESTVQVHTDPVGHAVLYSVTLTNQDALAHTVTLTDCLIPALDGEASRPDERTLRLSLGDGRLCHSLYTKAALLDLSVQTDRRKLLGRGDSLRHPERLSLHVSGMEDASVDVCLSFSARLKLKAHDSATLLFATHLEDSPARDYDTEQLDALRTLSRLAARSQTDSLSLTQEQMTTLSRVLGALLWREQAHQGAQGLLRVSAQTLEEKGLDVSRPILTLHMNDDDGSLVRQAADVASWLLLTGWPVCLCILCGRHQMNAMEELLAGSLLREHPEGSVFVLPDLSPDEAAALDAISRLVLFAHEGTPAQQVEALSQSLPATHILPALPERLIVPDDLLFDNGFSGFDAQTGDCVLHPSASEGPLIPWVQLLASSRLATLTDDRGIHASKVNDVITEKEDLYVLDQESGAWLSATPGSMAQELSWQTRFTPGATVWQTAAEEMDLTLTAACMPRYACGLRTLRLRNRSTRTRELMLYLTVSFVMGDSAQVFLTDIEGGMTAQSPLMSGFGFVTLTEGNCTTHTLSRQMLQGESDFPSGLQSTGGQQGSTALLRLNASIPADGSYTLSWLTGYALHADDMELMLRRIRRSGASAVYRAVRQRWSERTSAMVFHTPEKSLDLLLNHWLPNQFLRSHAPLTLLARTLLEPAAVRPQLLLLARDHACDSLLPLLTAHYVRITGDEAALNDLVPHDAQHPDEARDTLYARCLLALQDDTETTLDVLLRMMAVNAFMPFADQPDQELLQTVRTALHAHWDSLKDLHADVQTAAWAVLAMGVQPKTAALVRQVCQDDYLPMLGVLRAAPSAPQDTLSAAWMVTALAQLGWTDRAWELLRALNPIHHTDDPYRSAEYRAAPFTMAQSVYADAPHAGQGSAAASAEAAAVLYVAIVEYLLGLERHGEHVLYHPLPPEDWDSFQVTMRVGASTWHIDLGHETAFSLDGQTIEPLIELIDDGRVHQVRVPLHLHVNTPYLLSSIT